MLIQAGGEHGVHSMVLSPDGQSIYLVIGNSYPANNIAELQKSRLANAWGEDHILPRLWDPRGHAKGKLAPGGVIIKTDKDGREFELISMGYRNQFDVAFNLEGDLFTYDADMEWDVGSPWYRPTRVNHIVSGSDYGWRSGSGKWPEYYADSLPATINIGPGSPTGVSSGKGAAFP
jgi:glucose/arabinose dehydrogenase